jgi:hypothetical protein
MRAVGNVVAIAYQAGIVESSIENGCFLIILDLHFYKIKLEIWRVQRIIMNRRK